MEIIVLLHLIFSSGSILCGSSWRYIFDCKFLTYIVNYISYTAGEERKDDFDVATGVNDLVSSFFLSLSMSTYNPKRGITKSRGPLKTIVSF